MNRFNKKLYYKYFDLYRISSFLNDNKEEERSLVIMRKIKEAEKLGLDLSKDEYLCSIENDNDLKAEVIEFRSFGLITAIEKYKENVPDWIKSIILPDFFDPKWLSEQIKKNNIKTKEELCQLFKCKEISDTIGIDQAYLYIHFVNHADWNDFPINYARKYNENDIIENEYLGVNIKGNFHNHSSFSDGIYTIRELKDIAYSNHREYIGISDHTKKLNGITDETLVDQHKIIDSLNLETSCKILKSAECEVLSDGSLDLSEQSLKLLDYTIIAIHRDTCQIKPIVEKRLIKAIENPFSNILAHPSARLFQKKVELCVDMYKIIDACAANNVAIEINGDPERLDLDLKYISYALEKGVMVTFDSDTHLPNSFKNINNAIHIARDFNIPPELCLNTKNLAELRDIFKK